MVHIPITDTMPDLRGRLIDEGRLLLLDTLGSGAYGRVYRALDKTSAGRRYFAVKCLAKPDAGSHQAEFQSREFANHKRVCDHPNIITLHKVLFDRHYIYVILDLCTGGDLFAAITEKQIFQNNTQLVKTAFSQLLDAVQHCHEQGVFHRDIKPENVLCSEDGAHIWLADFGLSTRNNVSKDFGCGSSYYMSPECIGKELALGRYSTRHSDIWSLGIILTNMISGRNPWRYATTKDDCFSAYLHDKDFLRQVLPISIGANDILKRIFKLNPLCRISLPELRQETLALETFFLDRAEPLAEEGPFGETARTDAKASPGEKDYIIEDPLRETSDSTTSSASLDSEEQYTFSSPPDDHPPPTVDLDHQDSGRLLGAPTSGESSSGGESVGPITPATLPVDPDIEVPELPGGDGIGQPAIYNAIQQERLKPNAAENTKVSPGKRQLFRMALQRLRG